MRANKAGAPGHLWLQPIKTGLMKVTIPGVLTSTFDFDSVADMVKKRGTQ